MRITAFLSSTTICLSGFRCNMSQLTFEAEIGTFYINNLNCYPNSIFFGVLLFFQSSADISPRLPVRPASGCRNHQSCPQEVPAHPRRSEIFPAHFPRNDNSVVVSTARRAYRQKTPVLADIVIELILHKKSLGVSVIKFFVYIEILDLVCPHRARVTFFFQAVFESIIVSLLSTN